MEKLYIAPESSTPEISFIPEDSELIISGRSFPLDPVSFYKPVFEWLDNFLSEIKTGLFLNLKFKLDYYNTSTSKQFARLFKILEDSSIKSNVIVEWFYYHGDQDMFDAGERFSQLTDLKFEFIKKESW